MYWFILGIAFLSGIAFFFYMFNEDKINDRVHYVIGICFLLSSLSSYIGKSSFDEVSINDYELVVDSKEKCIKYPSCEEELKNILADGKVKKYELLSYKEILENEVKKDEAREQWKKELDRDMKNKEKLEQIKKELEKK
jgi:hypothetical protein